MAEIVGVVASGISVAQIAGQLLGCIQQLRTLCRALRDTPEELQEALEELEILGEVFYSLGTLRTDSSQPGHSALQASLTRCRTAASKLHAVVIPTFRPLKQDKKRSWYVLKAVLKRDEVKELKGQLEAAKSLLHLATACYSLNMQQKHIALLEVHRAKPPELGLDWSEGQPVAHGLRIVPQEDSNKLQIGLSRRQRSLQRSKSTCHNYKRTSIWISLSSVGIPYAILASLDITWTIHQSVISPSLQVTRVVDWQSPAFALLRDIRWNQINFEEAQSEIMRLFDSGAASPLDVLPNGKSLPENLLRLPWPNGDTQLKILELLVRTGSQINSAGILRCCLGWKGLGPWKTGLDDKLGGHTHLMNRMLKLGFDPSEIEVPTLSEWPRECSPIPEGYYDVYDDAFFIDWIAEGLRVSPGFAGSSSLQEAILIESSEVVERILHEGQVQEDINILGQEPLHLAVWRPQHLKALLQAGYDVNARDWNGRTPLMYAAAAGMTEVAVLLVRAGADTWAEDNLYSKHSWLLYAALSNHWQLIMDVIDAVRQSTKFSTDQIQMLLDTTIKLWARGVVATRPSSHFASLLEWGANPEVKVTAHWPSYKASNNTLLHCISNSTDFDMLMRGGFTNFNHQNSEGDYALMFLLEAGDPTLIQKSVTAGCRVDNQDDRGRTALHVCAEILRSKISPEEADFRLQILECTKVLLSNCANPFLGDCCRCRCSTSGCTPTQVLLKDFHERSGETNSRSYPLSMYTLVNEWFRILKAAKKEFEHSRRFMLDMIRLAKFEQLQLTHTCFRFVGYEYRTTWITLDEEDVEEILDEESELSVLLESEMKNTELCSPSELEVLWLAETNKLMEIQGRNFQDDSPLFILEVAI